MISGELHKNNLSRRLKNAGYSVTKPRQLVFDALQTLGPKTMHDLYVYLSPEIDRTTVYRVIDLLEKQGIAQKVTHGWKYTVELTDEFVPHHHHFTCTNCAKVTTFDEPPLLDELLASVEGSHNLKINTHSLELSGLCASCKNVDRK